MCEIARPRHVRPPKRFDQHCRTAPAHKFTSAEDYFRVQYFAFVDGVVQQIVERFDQPGMKTYCDLESVLLSACRGEEVGDGVNKLCELYYEFDRGRLELQLRMLPSLCSCRSESVASIASFADLFRKKPAEVRSLFCEVERLLQLLLVVPLPAPQLNEVLAVFGVLRPICELLCLSRDLITWRC